MARRMIRDRATHGTGAAWDWYLRAARRRFTTPAGWRIAQLAGRAVFDARTPTHGTAGDVDALLRQGLVRRTRRPRADCAAIGGPGTAVGGWDRFDPDRRRPMPRAYSTDLRERALAAYEAGEGRQSEVARLYRI